MTSTTKGNERKCSKCNGTGLLNVNEQSNQTVSCPCDFCNGKKYTVSEYLKHIDQVTKGEKC